MRLLVSVRDAGEARAALAGGAEIVDAKDPARGSIGAVSAEALQGIRLAVPESVRLSAALGDVATFEDIARAMERITVPLGYVKLGFHGVRDAGQAEALLREAVRRAARLPARPRVIAVAYADAARVHSLPPDAFQFFVPEAGADGLLVDTCLKDGQTLFDFVEPAGLASLASALAADEIPLAVGGSLGLQQVRAASEAGAQIFGVRGAVCRGGRNGIVDDGLVRDLAQAVRLERARTA
ncbi:MAG: hypothetical protein JNM53_03840 [Gemmatimonadetes bacterium]|nr:hypothetical protein [Gemmatimonadota bacterium]